MKIGHLMSMGDTVKIGHLVGIVTIVAVLVALFAGLDARSDTKVAESARQVREDVIAPMVKRMDRFEARQVEIADTTMETNGLLRNLLAELRK